MIFYILLEMQLLKMMHLISEVSAHFSPGINSGRYMDMYPGQNIDLTVDHGDGTDANPLLSSPQLTYTPDLDGEYLVIYTATDMSENNATCERNVVYDTISYTRII